MKRVFVVVVIRQSIAVLLSSNKYYKQYQDEEMKANRLFGICVVIILSMLISACEPINIEG